MQDLLGVVCYLKRKRKNVGNKTTGAQWCQVFSNQEIKLNKRKNTVNKT